MSERLKALNDAKATDCLAFWGLHTPKCPHCGTDYDIGAHDAWSLYEEGDHEVECGNLLCEREFTVSVMVSYTFSTDDQPDDDEDAGETQ